MVCGVNKQQVSGNRVEEREDKSCVESAMDHMWLECGQGRSATGWQSWETGGWSQKTVG